MTANASKTIIMESLSPSTWKYARIARDVVGTIFALLLVLPLIPLAGLVFALGDAFQLLYAAWQQGRKW